MLLLSNPTMIECKYPCILTIFVIELLLSIVRRIGGQMCRVVHLVCSDFGHRLGQCCRLAAVRKLFSNGTHQLVLIPSGNTVFVIEVVEENILQVTDIDFREVYPATEVLYLLLQY